MFQCPPSPDNSKPSGSTKESSSKQGLKKRKSTGWSWPRLVSVNEHRESSTSASTPTGSSSPTKRESTGSASGSLRVPAAKKTDMPKVKEESEADVRDDKSSGGGSARTMTHRSMQVSTDSGVDQDAGNHASKGPLPNAEPQRSSVSSSRGGVTPLEEKELDRSTDVAASETTSMSEGPRAGGPIDKAGHPGERVPNRYSIHGTTSGILSSESNLSKSSSARRISIAEPLPLPQIKVQQPSEISETPEPRPRTPPPKESIDRRLAEERRQSHQQLKAKIAQDIANEIARTSSPQPTETSPLLGDQLPPKTLRPKKSAIAMRKTRRVVVRTPFLKFFLGRDLAGPVKLALGKRANGEMVAVEDVA